MRSRLVVLAVAANAFVLVVALVTGAFLLGAQQAAPRPPAAATGEASPATTDQLLTITELLRLIDEQAVDAPDEQTLLEGAIEGLLDTLDDPYAVYYDAADFASFNQQLEGQFTGVGLLLEDTPDGAEVLSIIPDSPAEAAGIEPGERIVTVDGEDVSNVPVSGIVNLVRGPEGEPVTLGFEGGSEGPREVELIRAELDLPVLEAELLDDGAGYIRLWSFSERSGAQVRDAVEDLVEQGATGIVLDLRDNPGGLLSEAVEVASVFVNREVVVSVVEADGDERTLRAGSDALADLPLAVLVNDRSASASEIVAGAMQDHGRAPIIGVTTFGKGTVQTVRRLTDGSGVKFTTAAYFTPSGDSIEETGVVPDDEIADPDEQLDAAQAELSRQAADRQGSRAGSTTGPRS